MSLSKFLQSRLNTLIFERAPLPVATSYLKCLGKFYYIVNRRERRRIERNIDSVFARNGSAEHIRRMTFDGIYAHYVEKLLMAYRDMDELIEVVGTGLRCEGREYLEDALSRGGVLLVTGHIGAVEYLPLALHLNRIPVSMVVACHTERLRKRLADRARERDVELIDGHGNNVVGGMFEALNRGRVVITECDEVDAWRTKAGDTIPAFGTRVLRDRALNVICRRSGAEVLAAFLLRDNKGYRLVIEPVAETAADEDIGVRVFRRLEETVMKFPEQWYQWKKFDKMTPESA